jgi:hypothetical protein
MSYRRRRLGRSSVLSCVSSQSRVQKMAMSHLSALLHDRISRSLQHYIEHDLKVLSTAGVGVHVVT